jgi:nitrite reductase/ring-hydroxylating ferredoxin subunit/uncharacterized membrane protein
MIERLAEPLSRLLDPLARGVNWFYRALGTPGRYLQDFANGVFLGHTLHATLVDVVIGAATAALFLDILTVFFGVQGLDTATAGVEGLAFLAAIGSILTGLTDFKDTAHGDERNVTGFHGLINIIGTGGLAFSTMLRINDEHDAARWALLIGYLVLSAGAYVGGHVVFKYGYMVNRNAFARGKRAAEFTPLMPLSDLPDNTPTRASLGATALVVVRRGDVVHALKDTCSHAGGPLSEGKLDGDGIVCPWHGSTFRLEDGSVRHGPATTRQVSYQARINGDQVEVQGPLK